MKTRFSNFFLGNLWDNRNFKISNQRPDNVYSFTSMFPKFWNVMIGWRQL